MRDEANMYERVGQHYRDREACARKAILNVASSGSFSSGRTIQQYAQEIGHAVPCPIE
jgi:starch phosphorylase